ASRRRDEFNCSIAEMTRAEFFITARKKRGIPGFLTPPRSPVGAGGDDGRAGEEAWPVRAYCGATSTIVGKSNARGKRRETAHRTGKTRSRIESAYDTGKEACDCSKENERSAVNDTDNSKTWSLLG